MANRDEPLLAVVPASVGNGRVPARENLAGIGKVDSLLRQHPGTLGRIEPDPHFCTPDK